MKQTHHIGYVQTPSVKNLSNVKNALVENGLVPITTPNEMLPDAIEKGLVEFENEILNRAKDYGMIYEGKYRIRYFDIDGKILKIEYVAEGGKLTPPNNPTYDPDYLIFDEWNYDIENYIVEQPTDVGAMYKTVDDITYLFCRFTAKTGLNPTLAISGFTSIDWGDGTVNTNVSHTYVEEGNYLIKINGELTFNTSSSVSLLGSSTLNASLTKAYLSKITNNQLESYIFAYCNSLTNVSIPKNVTNLKNTTFNACYSLNHINIPKGVDSIYANSFYRCYSIKSVSMPINITTLYDSCFSECYSLCEIILSKGITQLNSRLFYNNKSLKNIWIPKELTKLSNTPFYSCSCVLNIFMDINSIPTLGSINDLNNSLLTSSVLWINDGKIEGLKVATNWSTFVEYMKPLSWYPSLTDPNAE